MKQEQLRTEFETQFKDTKGADAFDRGRAIDFELEKIENHLKKVEDHEKFYRE